MSAPGLDGVRPRDVLRVRSAGAERTVPAVGDDPPTPLPGWSARQLLTALAVGGGLLFVAVATTTTVTGEHPAPVVLLVVMALVLAASAVLVVLALRVQTRLFAELQHGYTTVRLHVGRVRGDRWRQRTTGGGHATWDYGGTWVLRSDGTVVAAPRRDLDAPGFWPSPTDPDRRELWTGRCWTGRFSD